MLFTAVQNTRVQLFYVPATSICGYKHDTVRKKSSIFHIALPTATTNLKEASENHDIQKEKKTDTAMLSEASSEARVMASKDEIRPMKGISCAFAIKQGACLGPLRVGLEKKCERAVMGKIDRCGGTYRRLLGLGQGPNCSRARTGWSTCRRRKPVIIMNCDVNSTLQWAFLEGKPSGVLMLYEGQGEGKLPS